MKSVTIGTPDATPSNPGGGVDSGAVVSVGTAALVGGGAGVLVAIVLEGTGAA